MRATAKHIDQLQKSSTIVLLQKLQATLLRLEKATTTTSRLATWRRIKLINQELENREVRAARAHGASWAQIASHLEISLPWATRRSS